MKIEFKALTLYTLNELKRIKQMIAKEQPNTIRYTIDDLIEKIESTLEDGELDKIKISNKLEKSTNNRIERLSKDGFEI